MIPSSAISSASEPASPGRPRVLLVGGPDVDARIDLMRSLEHDFEVSALGTDPLLASTFAASGFRYRHYRMSRGVNPIMDASGLWQLVRIFRMEAPDIVHTFDTKPGVWGRLAARIARVPVVIGTLPGLGSLYATPGRRGKLVRLAYQPLQTLACRLADRTIFQNGDDAREFQKRRVVARRKTVVIGGSGVRTDVLRPQTDPATAEYRSELGLPEHGLIVLTVTRVLRSKGVLELARAAREVRLQDPSIRFVLAGPADDQSMDALTAGELDELRDALTWIGPRRDVQRLLALADVFVFPSFYREGIPRALLEAASMALPLIAADVAGSREVVEHGVNGLLIAPRDAHAIAEAVLRLAREPDLRARFGMQARTRAIAEFDLAAIAARTASLYHELLPQGSA
jgi:glycosyltransferase involved in cell wall biosynthesis